MNTIFKALSDSTRREILQLLKDGDLSAGKIAEHFSISKPSVSHHLDILKRADLVTMTKAGQQRIYSLNASIIDELLSWAIDLQQNRDEK